MVNERLVLRPHEWPDHDRQQWEQALRSDGLFASSSISAEWRPRTVEMVAAGYGYALAWLRRHRALEPELPPVQRWTDDRLGEFLADMRDLQLSGATVRNRLVCLERALAVISPESDRSALHAAVRKLPTTDGRDRKRPCLQDPAELVTLGFRLMVEAEAGALKQSRMNAANFRDGLQIALLALRPLRKTNFASLRIGTHLVLRNGAWWLLLHPNETKTKEHMEVPFPEQLLPALERYMEHYRPLLAGNRYRADRLWVGYRFNAQSAHTIQLRITDHTSRAFGLPISPHLFRDCVATSIALHDPQNVRMAATILGHRTLATTQKHYNLAQALEAGRDYSSFVSRRRRILPS